MIIAIDFDGTCVTHEFPEVGKEIGAAPVLKKLVENDHKLILYTMRSDIVDPVSTDDTIHPVGGNYLTEAIEWFKKNDIPLWAVNENPEQKNWTNSPKIYAHLYIDDAALGTPLTVNPEISKRPFVNWNAIQNWFAKKGLINNCEYLKRHEQ